eukprot:2085728-Rhodomonas_salina.1
MEGGKFIGGREIGRRGVVKATNPDLCRSSSSNQAHGRAGEERARAHPSISERHNDEGGGGRKMQGNWWPWCMVVLRPVPESVY